jgi:hypothetical protein
MKWKKDKIMWYERRNEKKKRSSRTYQSFVFTYLISLKRFRDYNNTLGDHQTSS